LNSSEGKEAAHSTPFSFPNSFETNSLIESSQFLVLEDEAVPSEECLLRAEITNEVQNIELSGDALFAGDIEANLHRLVNMREQLEMAIEQVIEARTREQNIANGLPSESSSTRRGTGPKKSHKRKAGNRDDF
jgi:hypothetical protein